MATMLGLETEYDDFVALLNSVDGEFQTGTGKIDLSEFYEGEKIVNTKDIILTGESALSHGRLLCLRFNAETGKFLGGWCDDWI